MELCLLHVDLMHSTYEIQLFLAGCVVSASCKVLGKHVHLDARLLTSIDKYSMHTVDSTISKCCNVYLASAFSVAEHARKPQILHPPAEMDPFQ